MWTHQDRMSLLSRNGNMNCGWGKDRVGGKVYWLAGVWKVSGFRKTVGKQRRPFSLGENDIKHVLFVRGFRLPQRCKRDLGSCGILRSVHW
jgi:hypothetical protein